MNKLYGPAYLQVAHDLFQRTKQRSYELLSPNEYDDIADFGCGIGLDAIALARYGASVVGIDNDDGFIEIARASAGEHLHLEFVCGDATGVELRDASFNKVRFDRVFQHCSDHDAVLREAHRLLRTHGIIQIVDPDYLSMTFFSKDVDLERRLVDHVAMERIPNGHKVRQLPAALLKAGFALTSVEVHNYILRDASVVYELVRFDNVLQELVTRGTVGIGQAQEWLLITNSESNQFNFSLNMMLLMAEKNEENPRHNVP